MTALDLVARAATVPGLNAVDLNFPDHLEGTSAKEFVGRLGELGLSLNGFAMRYYTEPAFKLGAFTNPDPVANVSWNSSHKTPGCSTAQLASVGGAGYFYCFAAK